MKKIKIKEENYKNDDAEKIQTALKNYNYDATVEQCIKLWELYSDSLAASWIVLPDDDFKIVSCVLEYFSELK